MIPQFLYQYTTMESLKAILDSGNIRFTRLDKLNDPLEGLCGEFAELKKTVYVSSWSAEEDESIPMWSMYARNKDSKNLSTGVRIKMPMNMFSFDENGLMKDTLSVKSIQPGRWDVCCDITPLEVPELNPMFPRGEKNSSGKRADCVNVVYGPSKVRYCNLIEFSKMSVDAVLDITPEHFKSFDPKMIGTLKVKDWMYENEYRYWIQFPNCKYLAAHENLMKQYPEMETNGYIDIPYNKNALKSISIVTSPNFDESYIPKLEDVIKVYNCKYEKSSIQAIIK